MTKQKPILELADFNQANILAQALEEEGVDHRIETYSYIGNYPGNPVPWTYGNYGRLWAFAEDEARIQALFSALQEAQILPEDDPQEDSDQPE